MNKLPPAEYSRSQRQMYEVAKDHHSNELSDDQKVQLAKAAASTTLSHGAEAGTAK